MSFCFILVTTFEFLRKIYARKTISSKLPIIIKPNIMVP